MRNYPEAISPEQRQRTEKTDALKDTFRDMDPARLARQDGEQRADHGCGKDDEHRPDTEAEPRDLVVGRAALDAAVVGHLVASSFRGAGWVGRALRTTQALSGYSLGVRWV